MTVSQNFFDLRKALEGLKTEAYQDSAGIWTIGMGTTHYPNGTAVQEGDTCTEEEAINFASHDTEHAETFVNNTLIVELNQGQFDACVDFTYNAGVGAWQNSTLRKLINANPSDFDNITENFEVWDKAHVDGQLVVVNGLLRRRKCEAYLYQNGVNHPTFFE